MAQLLVRSLEPTLVAELRQRAAREGRSMEAEHREILRDALIRNRNRPSLKALIQQMPSVGSDSDFARVQQRSRRVKL